MKAAAHELHRAWFLIEHANAFHRFTRVKISLWCQPTFNNSLRNDAGDSPSSMFLSWDRFVSSRNESWHLSHPHRLTIQDDNKKESRRVTTNRTFLLFFQSSTSISLKKKKKKKKIVSFLPSWSEGETERAHRVEDENREERSSVEEEERQRFSRWSQLVLDWETPSASVFLLVHLRAPMHRLFFSFLSRRGRVSWRARYVRHVEESKKTKGGGREEEEKKGERVGRRTRSTSLEDICAESGMNSRLTGDHPGQNGSCLALERATTFPPSSPSRFRPCRASLSGEEMPSAGLTTSTRVFGRSRFQPNGSFMRPLSSYTAATPFPSRENYRAKSQEEGFRVEERTPSYSFARSWL